MMEQYRGTTICSVRRGNTVVMGGDGQVTLGNTVMKSNARKVRRLYKDRVLAGFAGATADAFTLFERFEGKLEAGVGHQFAIASSGLEYTYHKIVSTVTKHEKSTRPTLCYTKC